MAASILNETLHAHLIRLLAWAAISITVGLTFRKRPFGVMTAAWGAINGIIALASLHGAPPGAAFRPFLAFNLGLDLGYVAVGVAMALLGGERSRVKGFGWAIVVQGAALFALDLWLWLMA